MPYANLDYIPFFSSMYIMSLHWVPSSFLSAGSGPAGAKPGLS